MDNTIQELEMKLNDLFEKEDALQDKYDITNKCEKLDAEIDKIESEISLIEGQIYRQKHWAKRLAMWEEDKSQWGAWMLKTSLEIKTKLFNGAIDLDEAERRYQKELCRRSEFIG